MAPTGEPEGNALEALLEDRGYTQRDLARLRRALGAQDDATAAERLVKLGERLALDAADWCIGRSRVSVPSDYDALLVERLLQDVRDEELIRPKRGLDRRLTDELGLTPSRARTVQQRFPPPAVEIAEEDVALQQALEDLDTRIAYHLGQDRYAAVTAHPELDAQLKQLSADELKTELSVWFRGDRIVQRLVKKAYDLVLYDVTRGGAKYGSATSWKREAEGYRASLRTWLTVRAALPDARDRI